MSLLMCTCDRGYHLMGDDPCPDRVEHEQPSRLWRGIGFALLLSLPLYGLIYAAVKLVAYVASKLAGVL
jgi:hypothetical protein